MRIQHLYLSSSTLISTKPDLIMRSALHAHETQRAVHDLEGGDGVSNDVLRAALLGKDEHTHKASTKQAQALSLTLNPTHKHPDPGSGMPITCP